MPWRAEHLTTLKPGDRLTVLVLPDDEGGEPQETVLEGRVAWIELVEGVRLPWADYIEGAGDVPGSLLMSQEQVGWGLSHDREGLLLVAHVPVGDGERCEQVWVIPDA